MKRGINLQARIKLDSAAKQHFVRGRIFVQAIMLAHVSHSPDLVENNVTRLLVVAFHCKLLIGLRCCALQDKGETLHELLKLFVGLSRQCFWSDGICLNIAEQIYKHG